MRLVCSTLGVARSHLVALLNRPAGWVDRRRARSRSDEAHLLRDIRQVVHERGPYGYRRVWGVLRHQHACGALHERFDDERRDLGMMLAQQIFKLLQIKRAGDLCCDARRQAITCPIDPPR